MKYEGLMQFLNEIPKSDFFRDPVVVRKFVAGVRKFKLTRELMGRLKEEEAKICETSEKRVNLIYPTKTDFKYYIEIDGKHIAVYFAG